MGEPEPWLAENVFYGASLKEAKMLMLMVAVAIAIAWALSDLFGGFSWA